MIVMIQIEGHAGKVERLYKVMYIEERAAFEFRELLLVSKSDA